jgi:hypothetical protein
MRPAAELFEQIACAIVVGDSEDALHHLRALAADHFHGGWTNREAIERGRTCLRARKSKGVTS